VVVVAAPHLVRQLEQSHPQDVSSCSCAWSCFAPGALAGWVWVWVSPLLQLHRH